MGIFIRAPVRHFTYRFHLCVSSAPLRHPSFRKVITELLPSVAHEPPIEVVSRLSNSLLPHSASDGSLSLTQSVVALRQGRYLLTTFHPELTGDSRFHEYFMQECVIPSLAS
jgi:5'-phosphate synthase pdxT subunit